MPRWRCDVAALARVAVGLALPPAEMRPRTGSPTGTLSHNPNLTGSLGGGGNDLGRDLLSHDGGSASLTDSRESGLRRTG